MDHASEGSSLKKPQAAARWQSETGAVLVFTGLIVLALTGFLVFVIDQGVLLVARGQLQNAADAGALSGAVARTFDNATGPFDDTIASATQAALANPVFVTGTSGVVVDPDVACPVNGAVNDAGSCVRVDVHRDGTQASDALPVIFGSVLEIASQRAKATATAQAANANATTCFKPLLIPDWPDGTFVPGTLYTPPTSAGPGTGGYTTSDFGPVTLQPAMPGVEPQTGRFSIGGPPGDLLANLENCQLTQVIGDPIDQSSALPVVADVVQGLNTLAGRGITRIVIGLYNPESAAANPGGPLQVVNLVGFEVSGIDGSGTLSGRIVGASGELRSGIPAPGGEAGLIRAIRLLR